MAAGVTLTLGTTTIAGTTIGTTTTGTAITTVATDSSAPRGTRWAAACRPPLMSVLRKLEADLAIALRVIAPALAHLDEQEQVNRLADHVGNVAPGLCADPLDGVTGLAEHDLALAFALDVDRLLDPHRAVLELLPGLRLDGRLVGQFLVQPQVQLFARDLGREAAQRRVGDLI